MKKVLAAALVAAVFGLTACTAKAPEPGLLGGADAERLGELALEIRGHMAAAVALAQADRVDMAVVHTAHPLGEYQERIEALLGADDAAVVALRAAVQALAATDPGDATALDAAADDVRQALDPVLLAGTGGAAISPRYRAATAAGVLTTAVGEYQEGVVSGAVVNVAEYQDAWGFVHAIGAWLDEASPALDDRAAVDASLAALAERIPGPVPPSAPTEPDAFASSVAATRTALADAAGIQLAAAGSAGDPGLHPEPAADPEAPSMDMPFTPSDDTLVIYSGRSESLVGPIVERFRAETGLDVQVRWGNTGELAATLLEEGAASPADVFFAQEPGGLGAVEGLLAPLPADLLDEVTPRFRDPDGRWIGVSGRARVVVYNTDALDESKLPADLRELTDPAWRGRIGWAPTNASFQTMVTAMRKTWGENETLAWLNGMAANEPASFDGNAPIVAAVGAGEIDLGLVNHYYLYRFLAEEGDGFPARNHFMDNGGPDALVMAAGAGRLASAAHPEAAERFIRYLVSPDAQTYFVDETFEYPVRVGLNLALAPGLPPIETLSAPDIDLADLADLKGTVAVLREAGVLP